MRPLEFDVLARSFADGFSRALSELFGKAVVVGVSFQNGHLETIKTAGFSEVPLTQFGHSFDYVSDWYSRARPVVQGHVENVARMGREQVDPSGAALILRDVNRRMEEVTYLHHTLVLPARMKLVEFVQFAYSKRLVCTSGEALCLLAGDQNNTTGIAEALWSARYRTDDPGEIAQEGDGYGLGCPNWLEDSSVPVLIRALYRKLGSGARPAALLSRACRRRERWLRAVELDLRDSPPEVRVAFRRLWAEAKGALQITEEHAPLMHARLPHELRALAVRLGAKLSTVGQLDQPEDIFYLHLDELASCPSGEELFLRKQVRMHRYDIEHATPPSREEQDSADCYGDSVAAGLFRQLFQPASLVRTPETLRGHPGSPGYGVGRVRRLFWQRDVGSIRPGDVLVTPDSANGWSYALPAATAVVAESGHPYGHLASLARDYITPAVIGTGDTRDSLRDGRLVEVDGTAGEVRLLVDQSQERQDDTRR